MVWASKIILLIFKIQITILKGGAGLVELIGHTLKALMGATLVT